MTGIDALETGTALESVKPVEEAEVAHETYALMRVEAVEILERLTNSKGNALEVFERLEAALLATSLLYAPDASKSSKSFNAGLAIFCKDLEG